MARRFHLGFCVSFYSPSRRRARRRIRSSVHRQDPLVGVFGTAGTRGRCSRNRDAERSLEGVQKKKAMTNSLTSLPRGVAGKHKVTLSGRFVVKVESACDVSRPLERRRDPTEILVEEDGDDTFSSANRSRMLRLHLSDGGQLVHAMEKNFISALPTQCEGFKIAITDPYIRMGMMLLNSNNVAVVERPEAVVSNAPASVSAANPPARAFAQARAPANAAVPAANPPAHPFAQARAPVNASVPAANPPARAFAQAQTPSTSASAAQSVTSTQRAAKETRKAAVIEYESPFPSAVRDSSVPSSAPPSSSSSSRRAALAPLCPASVAVSDAPNKRRSDSGIHSDLNEQQKDDLSAIMLCDIVSGKVSCGFANCAALQLASFGTSTDSNGNDVFKVAVMIIDTPAKVGVQVSLHSDLCRRMFGISARDWLELKKKITDKQAYTREERKAFKKKYISKKTTMESALENLAGKMSIRKLHSGVLEVATCAPVRGDVAFDALKRHVASLSKDD